MRLKKVMYLRGFPSKLGGSASLGSLPAGISGSLEGRVEGCPERELGRN